MSKPCQCTVCESVRSGRWTRPTFVRVSLDVVVLQEAESRRTDLGVALEVRAQLRDRQRRVDPDEAEDVERIALPTGDADVAVGRDQRQRGGGRGGGRQQLQPQRPHRPAGDHGRQRSDPDRLEEGPAAGRRSVHPDLLPDARRCPAVRAHVATRRATARCGRVDQQHRNARQLVRAEIPRRRQPQRPQVRPELPVEVPGRPGAARRRSRRRRRTGWPAPACWRSGRRGRSPARRCRCGSRR